MWAGGSGRSGRRSLGASQQWPRVSTSWSGSGGRLTLRSREALRRSRQSSSQPPSAQVGQGRLELLRPDVEEAVLVGADLVEVEVVVAGVEELLHRLDDGADVGDRKSGV